jgi:uncharacterized protein involved in outer membrane biogenesis
LSITLLGVAAVILVMVLVWDWNWFRPMLEARLSAALGCPVSMERLAVSPGRTTVVTAYGVRIGAPTGEEGPGLAAIPRLTVNIDAATWWHTRRIVVPVMELDQPRFDVQQNAAGTTNLPVLSGPSTVEIGDIHIQDGAVHIHSVREKSEITAAISTTHTEAGGALIIQGNGSHARQPITFRGVGGTILALRDTRTPYPVDVEIANGPTRITLKGKIDDPLALRGADLNLVLSGPDMELLLPLTGIATPKTPPYRVSGRLDFADGKVKFSDIKGRVGSSDLNGTLEVDPKAERPVVAATLISHQVDMADLGGFVGTEPGRPTTPGQTPKQVEEIRQAEANPRLLPDTPISIPKVRAADIHLTYRGEKILGRDIPFNSIEAKLDIDNGHIHVSPLRLGIGGGALSGALDLNPVGDQVDADANVKLEHVNIAHLFPAIGFGGGEGVIDGTAQLKGRGDSLLRILAHGDGAFRAVMPSGGNIDALLVDLMGVELGNAFFAAIGIPNKEAIRCMVADFVLRQGVLASRVLELDTTDHIIAGGARFDLGREAMEVALRADPKHFTIGKLATPILISGTLMHPHFAPAPELVIRGGAAIGLGILFPPAAILPTIQFGAGENSPCAAPGAGAAR